jgi:hypothetical protein
MLRPLGRLFVVVGRAPVMDARLITLSASGDSTSESLFETVLTLWSTRSTGAIVL